MKSTRHQSRHSIANALLNTALLMVFAALLVFSVFLVRAKLLQNAQTLGIALAHSYAAEAQQDIEALKRYSLLACQYIDEISADGSDPEAVQKWLEGYLAKLTSIVGENNIDPYAVIAGRIVAANPWEGDADYQYASTLWYQQALNAQGELVCGDVYNDAITGARIFTISKALEQPGDVFALDVHIQMPMLRSVAQTLPEQSSFYMCDQDGQLLCWIGSWDMDSETAQQRASFLLAGMHDGSLLAYDASFTDQAGQERGAYYCDMANGWTVILTMPINSILMGDHNVVVYAIAGVALVLFAALAFMTLRDIVQSRRVRRADDTAQMLGDSFYTICRVNFRQGQYEAIKLHPDLADLPPRGDYALLLKAMQDRVKSSTYQAFEQSFSLDSISRRAAQGVSDYGGDYQRLFGSEYRWVNVRTLYDAKVAPDEVILCFRDVDAEKRRELSQLSLFEDALAAAQSSTRARSEFFSRMSHDMRTPLNAIIGCCELAQRDIAAGDQSKLASYIGKVDFAGRQLLALINDILELSRMEAGKDALQQRSFDLKQLLEDTAGLFRVGAEREGKQFSLRMDMANRHVLGDAQKIVQIVNNLLSNALKYSEAGASIRLEVRQFAAQPPRYQIVVADTGMGMSPEFMEHLFEPYTRETIFASRARSGTGLGMPIVKNLVQQMNGEITVASELGRGSTFTVTLPLEPAPDDAPPPNEPAAPTEPTAPAKPFDWQGRTILVAEDNEINLDILTDMLESLGAQVLGAPDGAQAVRIFSESAPHSIDAILMDMQMPVMDGCQAAEAIRALERPDAAGVIMIAVTANAFAEDIARTARAGMDDHVAKPIDMELLTRTLDRLVRERAAN